VLKKQNEVSWFLFVIYEGELLMRLKNVLIVVKDIEKSKQFYHDLFGLDTLLNNEGNVILTEGLVLQEEKIWREVLQKDISAKSNSCELYFEEQDIEAFRNKLQSLYPAIEYVTPLVESSWGQKIMRFYDLDGHLIEVRDMFF
jgi:catechol 2,3-dioxygenase-like lactoylglutathione lyase family enzyme